MKKIFNHFKKYTRDYMITITVFTILLFAVMGSHFSDAAEKPFWWSFWDVIGYTALVLILAGWAYAFAKGNRKK